MKKSICLILSSLESIVRQGRNFVTYSVSNLPRNQLDGHFSFYAISSQRPRSFSSAPMIVTSIWEGPFSFPEPPFLLVTWSAKQVALGTRMGKVQFSEHAQRNGTDNNNKNNHPTLFKLRFRVARESYYLRVNERLWERDSVISKWSLPEL